MRIALRRPADLTFGMLVLIVSIYSRDSRVPEPERGRNRPHLCKDGAPDGEDGG